MLYCSSTPPKTIGKPVFVTGIKTALTPVVESVISTLQVQGTPEHVIFPTMTSSAFTLNGSV